MRFALSALTSVLLVAIFVSPLSFAHRSPIVADGPSAKGKFEILQLQGLKPTSVEFNAETTTDGRTIGEAVYQDNSQANTQPLYLRAELDCLVVKANKAVMSGSISESNAENYLGRRFLLVVQDNGATENPLKHDKLTWGVYRVVSKNWVLTDAERPDENGPVSWMVADAERSEDPGSFPDNNPSVGCQTFPISSFSFLDDTDSRGNARVKP